MKSKRHTIAELLAAAFDEADELPAFFEQVTDAVYRLESNTLPTRPAHNRRGKRPQSTEKRRLASRRARRSEVA